MGRDSDRYQPLPGLLELPSFLIGKLPSGQRRVVVAAGACALVALAAAAVVALPRIHAHVAADDARQAQRAAAARAALEARYAREARPRFGRGPAASGLDPAAALVARRRLMAALQGAVLADVRERARRGQVPGHYASTDCAGYPKRLNAPPPARDMAHDRARLECIAVARDVAAHAHVTTGSVIGQPYRALVDFGRGRFAFCKIVQMPGEMSIQRDQVLHIPPACGGDG